MEELSSLTLKLSSGRSLTLTEDEAKELRDELNTLFPDCTISKLSSPVTCELLSAPFSVPDVPPVPGRIAEV